MKRIQSGIKDFDTIIGGGFPQGRTCLLSGEAGTGKSIFAFQFLLEGLKNGEKAIYICIDEKPEQVISNMGSLGWDLSEYLDSGLLQIFDVSSYFSVSYLGDFDGARITKAIEDIMSFVKESNPERLVIDPISPLIFLDRPTSLIVQYIRTLIFNIEQYGKCTTLLTSYIPVGSEKDSMHGIAEYAVSGIIKFTLEKRDKDYHRLFRIKKLRGSSVNLSERIFTIKEKSGICVS